MTRLSEKIQSRLFGKVIHPYKIYERKILAKLNADSVLLDAGCGRTAPVLSKFVGKAKRLLGVELVEFDPKTVPAGVELIQANLAKVSQVGDASVDLVISRSVLEHIKEIEPVYREMHRILKPGGGFIFLVPNFGDYVSLISWIVPNKFHAYIVSKTEGRDTHDTFPAYYKSNSRSSVARLASRTGFRIVSCEYLGQSPDMLMFNAPLFLLGSLYEKLITWIRPLGFLRGWILVELVRE
jgi:ubiquinone/menaquinone biosynthesis C-methylase UbiE